MADIPDMDKLIASIRLHEGTGPVVNGKFMPYNDSLGNPTIAWGHLISKGITNAAGMQIFRDDLTDVRMEAEAQDSVGSRCKR